MLSVEEQDVLDFEKRLEQAKEKINRIYPAWTNYNPADSGMALLELFAYMTEMQQFHVEQIGKEHIRAFLHLLGMRPFTLQPAKVYGGVKKVQTPFILLKGTRASAGELVFEAEEAVYMEHEDCLINRNEAPFYPFGENPGLYETYDIGLRYELDCRELHTLYIRLCDTCPVSRMPMERENFLPLVELQLQYFDGITYQPCEIVKDTTFGLLQTGIVQFRIKSRMGKAKGEYRLRMAAEGEYDVAPQIESMDFNMVSFVQKDTDVEWKEYFVAGGEKSFYEIVTDTWLFVNGKVRIYQKTKRGYVEISQFSSFLFAGRRHFVIAKEALYEKIGDEIFRLVAAKDGLFPEQFTFTGTGKPDQCFYLHSKNVLEDAFSIWVENDSGFFEPWDQVSSLAQAGEGECCYLLEEENGVLRFGNGSQGRMPKGKIEIIAYAVCAGENGNIQKNQLSEFQQEMRAEGLSNLTAAAGGRNPESLLDCMGRYRAEREIKNRAVTLEDYEELVRRTPGLRIKKVKVFPSKNMENSLEIVVEPYTNGNRRLQGDGYDKNIMKYIGARKMLGTRIIIKKPEYIRIHVNLELVVKNHFRDTEERIRERIKIYFDRYMDFGKTVSYSHLYGYIDSFPETERIEMLELQAMGRGVTKERSQDIQLPFCGIAYLDGMELWCNLLST